MAIALIVLTSQSAFASSDIVASIERESREVILSVETSPTEAIVRAEMVYDGPKQRLTSLSLEFHGETIELAPSVLRRIETARLDSMEVTFDYPLKQDGEWTGSLRVAVGEPILNGPDLQYTRAQIGFRRSGFDPHLTFDVPHGQGWTRKSDAR